MYTTQCTQCSSLSVSPPHYKRITCSIPLFIRAFHTAGKVFTWSQIEVAIEK